MFLGDEGGLMKVRYKEAKNIRDVVLDFTESRFSLDEMMKQVAQRLSDNQAIYFVAIENAEINEKGAHALRNAVLGHKSLRHFALLDLKICSYPVASDDEYFFPNDLDSAVQHMCSIFRDARLERLDIINLDFYDRTQRRFEHFDMVDPAVMRDLLTQEKEPFYIKEIIYSLKHNPHLKNLYLSITDADMTNEVKEIEADIKKRQSAEQLNSILQGTHAAVETHLWPEIFKFVALSAWWHKIRKR